MKIGIFTASNQVCYDTLEYFAHCVEEALRALGVTVQRITGLSAEVLTGSWDAVIGINHSMLFEKLDNGLFLAELFRCPVFAVIVDPPYHYHSSFEAHMSNMYMFLLDQEHVAYCRKYYMPFRDVRMAYLLGPVGTYRNYEDREIDVLFAGTVNRKETVKQKIAELAPDWGWAYEFYELFIGVRMKHPEMTTLQAMIFLMEKTGIESSDGLLKTMMSVFGPVSDYDLRTYYRESLVRILTEAGIRIHVAGMGWEELYPVCPENLVLEGPVSFAQTAELISNAKIVLNIMPSFQNGIHDRVLTAMQNGAVCVTDYSTYVDTHFQDRKELILYKLEQLEMLPATIEWLLKNPHKAKTIAEAGRERASRDYTWDAFVKEYILDPLKAQN